MTNSRTIGVGVVGLGVGEQHARAFAAHPSCRWLRLADLDAARAQALAASIDGAVAGTFDEMLADPDVHAVAIASFDDAHYQQVIAALAAGKHVFVEKPVCRTIDELASVKERWLAAGGRLKLRSNLVLRAAPVFGWLQDQLRARSFGRLYAFDGDYLYGRLHKITGGWRRDVAEYSVFEGGGVHLVDLMLWLTGERPSRVTASGNRVVSEGSAFRYNDFVAAAFEFDSGLLARITANFGCVQPHQHVVRVFGTEATFLSDDCGPRWWRSRDAGRRGEPLDLAPVAAHKGDLIPAFVLAILDDGDDRVETQGFFDGIAVCIAADRAAASGQKEGIEYI